MTKFWKVLTLIMIVFGTFLLALAGYSQAAETYAFWKHGVEKRASVIELHHTRSQPKAGITYYYTIEIDGLRMTKGFRVRLPAGRDISVLVIPVRPSEITPGNRSSSLFEIFSHSIGGHVVAALVLAMYAFMLVATSWLAIKIWPVRREILSEFWKN